MQRLGGVISILMSVTILAMVAQPAHAAKARVAKTVATVGQSLPSTGFTMDFPDEPMVDSKGNVVFGAFYNSNLDSGIFYKPMKKGLSAVATTMVAISGLGTPTEFDGPAISSSGIIAFVARGGTADGLVRMQKGKALQVLMKTGDTAPGTGGATFVTFDDLSINKKGDTAVIATYTNGMTTKTGVFLFTSKGIIPIVLNGDPLPGTGGGTEDGTVPEDIDGPWVNDFDDVAFAADRINGATSLEGSVFLRKFNQNLQALLLMGSPGPTGVGGTISSIGIGRPALNDSDVLSFNAESTGGLVGSFVGVTAPGKGVVVCAKQGDSAPGTTGTFNAAEAPFGNANLAGNTALFHSNIMGDPNNLQGIFSCKNAISSPKLATVVLPTSKKPTGTYGSALEEDSISSKFAVFDDENGSPIGVFVIKLP
jgi:hypothetical protein